MATAAAPAANVRPTAAWSLAFRPFFLAAAIWAALALALWMALFMTGTALPSRFDPLTWHIHAMLFGFVLAAIAGFLLTAIPNWTGRAPVRGARLMALVALWLAARIAGQVSALLPLWLAAACDLAFPVALCLVAAHEIIAARNWRNLAMPLPVGILALADGLMYLDVAGFDLRPGLGWRLALAAVIILISVVGGRIIPAFTRNWLRQRRSAALPAEHGGLTLMALASLHGGLLGWALLPGSKAIGGLLLLAAALNFSRWVRWRGFATVAEPLLAILHVGYAWMILGAALLGASLLTDIVPQTAAIHAFTAGAMGTMVLAIMTRVSRGHTGRPLRADRATTLIYAAITLAAATRVAAAFAPASATALLVASALLWVMAFLLFVAAYGAMLLSPRIENDSRLA